MHCEGDVGLDTDLHKEEGATICVQGTAELNVAILGILFTEIVQHLVFSKNELLNPPDLNVFSWQELVQVQEASLVLCLIVVPIPYLTLQGCQLYGFLTCARVSPINDVITGLEGRKGGMLVGENERLG